MNDRRVIVSTSTIQTERPLYPGHKPVFEERWRNRVLETFSTGRLEAALGRNLEVYLVSVRPAFGTHDRWWQALIPPERVWNTPGIMSANNLSFEAVLLSPWIKLYAQLGIPWSNAIQKDDQARELLISEYGFTDGMSFRGYAAQQ